MNKGKVSNLVTKGQVLWVDLPDVESGSVQKGRRPVVVISNNKGNQFSPVILVAPLTSRKKKHLPTHVDVFASETNGIKSVSLKLIFFSPPNTFMLFTFIIILYRLLNVNP